MEDLLKKYEQSSVEEQTELYAEMVKEVASLKSKIQELSDAQESAKVEAEKVTAEKEAEIAELQAKIDEVTKEAEEAKAEIARRDAEITEAELAKRKEILGDFSEGMEDSDILDDVKYELALLKKENAELKAAAKIEKVEGEEPEMAKGSKGKDVED